MVGACQRASREPHGGVDGPLDDGEIPPGGSIRSRWATGWIRWAAGAGGRCKGRLPVAEQQHQPGIGLGGRKRAAGEAEDRTSPEVEV